MGKKAAWYVDKWVSGQCHENSMDEIELTSPPSRLISSDSLSTAPRAIRATLYPFLAKRRLKSHRQ